MCEAALGNTDALPPQDLAAGPGTQSCRFALDDLSVAQNAIRLLSFLLSLACARVFFFFFYVLPDTPG